MLRKCCVPKVFVQVSITEDRDDDANFVVTGGNGGCHKARIVMMPTLLSLVETEIVTTTTSDVVGDDKVSILSTVGFPWGIN